MVTPPVVTKLTDPLHRYSLAFPDMAIDGALALEGPVRA
jgi:hypothetical protein